MTAERPSPAVLEEWVTRSWDHRPPFTYECLVEMWQEEQASRAKAREADWRSQQLDELRRRVAALERALGPGGRRLADDLIAGIGGALGKIRAQDRERLLAEVERRGFVTYGGVWDEATEYPRGALVTHGGAAWVALTPAEKGLRPGKAPAWRLAVKGESSSRGPTAA
jgi:hypothetical protein